MIDPFIAIALYVVSVGVVAGISSSLGTVAAIVLPLVYLAWFLSLLRQGLTPGKMVMRLQVLDSQSGQIPGFGKMFVREIVGRIISGLLFGLGYLWAIFDKNGQAWHDKIANTVVVKVTDVSMVQVPPGASLTQPDKMSDRSVR